MQSAKKCSASGCIHWAWQEGQCKYHYANNRQKRSPSIGSPYEYMPELRSPKSADSSRRSSNTSEITAFDIKKLLSEPKETTFTMIKPDAAKHEIVIQGIALRFLKEGFTIMEYRKIRLSPKIATELYSIHKEKVWFSELLEYVTSGVAVIFAIRKENAIQDLRNLVGPTDPNEARKTDPDTLRALYGSSKQANAIHCSDSYENACRELEIFFPCNSFNGDVSFSSSSSSDSSSSSESSSESSSISTESS